LPHTRIQAITVDGNQEIDSEVIKQDVALFLDKSSLLIPYDSYFVFSRDLLVTHLQNQYPRIDTVDISVGNFDTLQIEISEHVTGYKAVINGAPYLVSNTGVVLEQVNTTASSSLVSLYLNTEYFDPTIGDQIIPEMQFQELTRFVQDLDTLGIVPRVVQLNNPIEYVLVVGDGAKLIINPRDDYVTYQAVLREILPYREFSYNFTQASFGQNVAYINLRYGKKILYCYRGDVCESNYPVMYE
jgi:hypothetical protein